MSTVKEQRKIPTDWNWDKCRAFANDFPIAKKETGVDFLAIKAFLDEILSADKSTSWVFLIKILAAPEHKNRKLILKFLLASHGLRESAGCWQTEGLCEQDDILCWRLTNILLHIPVENTINTGSTFVKLECCMLFSRVFTSFYMLGFLHC